MDLDAIVGNAREIRRHLDGAAMIAVVKEDGYGHGATRVARALEGTAGMFAVATVEQAAALRAEGVKTPVLTLLPIPKEETARARRIDVTPTVADEADLDRAPRFGSGFLGAHVKFDCGMGRLGFHFSRARATALLLRRRGIRRIAGVYAHLAATSEKSFTDAQVNRFDDCRRALADQGIFPQLAHLSNSEGVVTSPRACSTGVVRPGLMLYGCAPAATKVPFRITPAMSFKTTIAAVRDVPAGATISYGHTYTTSRRSKLAVLPVGYSAGYSRLLSNRGEVLIRGRRARVRGRVCMNLTVVDVTRIPGCRVGDEVVLFGGQGRARIMVDEVADHMRTISYEVLLAAGGLNPRTYRARRGRQP